MSDVKYSKLEVLKSFFPKGKSTVLNTTSGLVKIKNNKNFLNFINHSKNYLPFLKEASYIGSFFVVRTLSLNKNSVIKDERLNNLTIHGKILSVLSSKWNTSVWMAKKINELLKLS